MKDGQKSPWEIFKSKKNEKVDLRDEMHKDYINDDGFLVPEKTLAFYATSDTRYKLSDVIETLIGHPNRDWFSITAFSFCLPLTIANQYGFVVIAACGIAHCNGNISGIFEQAFGLLQDPNAEFSWKVKWSELRITEAQVTRNPLVSDLPELLAVCDNYN